MSQDACFICLENFESSSLRQLCSTCLGSKICGRCEAEALGSANPDVLTNCPICRRQVVADVQSRIVLFSFWHPITIFTWSLFGITAPFWQQFLMVNMSDFFLSKISRRVNRVMENSRPSLLKKRYTIMSWIVHVPYVITMALMNRPLDANVVFNLYIFGHLIFPITFVSVAQVVLARFNITAH